MPDEKPLESWKEVAVYLGRDMRTVRRWEKNEKLPVHRHLHQSRASRRGQSMVPAPGATTLVIRSLKSGEERDVRLKALGNFSQARWCAGGRSILGIGRDQKKYGICQVDAHTGEASEIAMQVPPAPYLQQPQCSPDGKSIFYSERDLSFVWRIRARNQETAQEKELYRAPQLSALIAMALSPDGRHVALAVGPTLLIIPAAGGEPRQLLSLQKPERITSLAWTPDGKQLLFGRARASKLDKQEVELWRIPAEGGEPQSLGLAMDRLADLAVHPDGRQIAFTAGKQANEVWVMENLPPKP